MEMKSLLEMSPRNLHKRGEEFDSIYLSPVSNLRRLK